MRNSVPGLRNGQEVQVSNGNYWDRMTRARLSRRRAIMATSGAAAAAAFLAACGGDDDTPSTTGSTGATGSTGSTGSTGATGSTGTTGSTGSGRLPEGVYEPVDTTSSAVQGGVMRHWAADDITHFDALASNSASTVN